MFQQTDGEEKVSRKLEELIGKVSILEVQLNDYNLSRGSKKLTVTKVYELNYTIEINYMIQSINKVHSKINN